MIILKSTKTDIKKAADLLKKGELVAFPTETVFGVACLADNYHAYQKLNKLKERPPHKPYTMMVKDLAMLKKFAKVNQKTLIFLKKFMPGSITVLLPSKSVTPKWAKENNVIGIRIPSNQEALMLLKEIDQPVLVPSLNRSGGKPINKISEIKKEFENELGALIIGKAKGEKPSTVISLLNGIKIVREGKIPSTKIIKEYKKL